MLCPCAVLHSLMTGNADMHNQSMFPAVLTGECAQINKWSRNVIDEQELFGCISRRGGCCWSRYFNALTPSNICNWSDPPRDESKAKSTIHELITCMSAQIKTQSVHIVASHVKYKPVRYHSGWQTHLVDNPSFTQSLAFSELGLQLIWKLCRCEPTLSYWVVGLNTYMLTALHPMCSIFYWKSNMYLNSQNNETWMWFA